MNKRGHLLGRQQQAPDLMNYFLPKKSSHGEDPGLSKPGAFRGLERIAPAGQKESITLRQMQMFTPTMQATVLSP